MADPTRCDAECRADEPTGEQRHGEYMLNSYFSANCNAARYNRTSEVLLLVIVGTLVAFSGARAGRREELRHLAPEPALI